MWKLSRPASDEFSVRSANRIKCAKPLLSDFEGRLICAAPDTCRIPIAHGENNQPWSEPNRNRLASPRTRNFPESLARVPVNQLVAPGVPDAGPEEGFPGSWQPSD